MLGCCWPACARNEQENATETKIARAVKVERAPRLDGTLNDPLWQSAKPIADFKQREPNEGEAATEQTEVRILYTRHEIYFGILCRDSNSKAIVAAEMRRDLPQNLDDYFEIIIDSNHDRRNAYVFSINPLGTQLDGLITEEQQPQEYGSGDFDPAWDGVWTSAAEITDIGWTATIGIPFSTLNFTSSKDVVWGLNLKRFIRRKNEEDLWSAYRRVFGVTKISQAGELQGISDIGSGRLFIVKPYALEGFQGFSGTATRALNTGGVDVKYGLRSNLVANLTANTDFADADVDQQQFNLTPYKLFFPEKRQFFLENGGVFNFSTGGQDLLFYSRQIGIDADTGQVVPINGGAKVAGSLGNYEIGFMDVDTRSDGPNPQANYAVARVKRSLFGDSYIGAMGIDKESGDVQDPFNRTGGIDARLVFFKNLVVAASAALTESPSVKRENTNIGADVSYQTNWLQLELRRTKIGANYNPEVGFVNQADSDQGFAGVELKARPKFLGIRELDFESSIFHAPDTHGVLQNQEWLGTMEGFFNNGAHTDDDLVDAFIQRINAPGFNIYKNIVIPPGLYHFTRHQLFYSSAQDRKLTYTLVERFGTYYTGRLNEAIVGLSYRPSARLSVSGGETWNRFTLPQGNFSVVLANLQLNYSLSRSLTTSALVQVDTSNAQAVSTNFRLRYHYRPDSDFFVVYNLGTRFASLTAANPQLLLRENRLEVKFTYSFTPSFARLHRNQPESRQELSGRNGMGSTTVD
jgi:hypothetical protein